MLSCGISEYFEFKSVNSIVILDEGKWMEIPLSKSEIFQSNFLTLIEKRNLVNFINRCLGFFDKITDNLEKSVNSTHIYEMSSSEDIKEIEGAINYFYLLDFAEKPIIDYMNKLKLNMKLIDILLYIIGGLCANQKETDKKMITKDYVCVLSKYLRSIGKYGPCPMIVPLYSTSEFPQALARYFPYIIIILIG